MPPRRDEVDTGRSLLHLMLLHDEALRSRAVPVELPEASTLSARFSLAVHARLLLIRFATMIPVAYSASELRGVLTSRSSENKPVEASGFGCRYGSTPARRCLVGTVGTFGTSAESIGRYLARPASLLLLVHSHRLHARARTVLHDPGYPDQGQLAGQGG